MYTDRCTGDNAQFPAEVDLDHEEYALIIMETIDEVYAEPGVPTNVTAEALTRSPQNFIGFVYKTLTAIDRHNELQWLQAENVQTAATIRWAYTVLDANEELAALPRRKRGELAKN